MLLDGGFPQVLGRFYQLIQLRLLLLQFAEDILKKREEGEEEKRVKSRPRSKKEKSDKKKRTKYEKELEIALAVSDLLFFSLPFFFNAKRRRDLLID